MNSSNQGFKKYVGLIGAVCGSLLIGLPAIAQMNANPSSNNQTNTVPARTAPENQPNSDNNQNIDLDRESPGLRDEIDRSRDGIPDDDSSEQQMNRDRVCADNRTDAIAQSRAAARSDDPALTQRDRIVAGNASAAQNNNLTCDDNTNEPGMNRNTPSGTMRDSNRQTSPNTRPLPPNSTP